MNQKNESTLLCENSPQLVEIKYLFLLDHFSEATDLFVTSKIEFSISPILEFKCQIKAKEPFKNPF